MSEHLDRAAQLSLRDVMEAEYPHLLDAFVLDSEERLRLLRQCQDSCDDLRRAAHSFKGSCSNMGVPLLTNLCRLLEDQMRQGQMSGAAGLIDEIEREFAIVRILLKSERQRYS